MSKARPTPSKPGKTTELLSTVLLGPGTAATVYFMKHPDQFWTLSKKMVKLFGYEQDNSLAELSELSRKAQEGSKANDAVQVGWLPDLPTYKEHELGDYIDACHTFQQKVADGYTLMSAAVKRIDDRHHASLAEALLALEADRLQERETLIQETRRITRDYSTLLEELKVLKGKVEGLRLEKIDQ